MSHYKLTSTVILHLANETEALGEMDLSGNMTRQVEVDLPVESDASHVANVGRLVEDMELKMRNLLRMFFSFLSFFVLGVDCWNGMLISFTEEVYFGKAKDVVGELRSMFSPTLSFFLLFVLTSIGVSSLSESSKERANHAEMIRSMHG